MGWLSSTIKYKKGKSDETTSKSEYYSGGLICSLPDVSEFRYLTLMWDELGRYQSSGMGISTTNWSEIQSFINLTECSMWEGQLLHAMSKVFVEARSMFSDLVCEPPYLYGGYDFRTLSADAADRRRRK